MRVLRLQFAADDPVHPCRFFNQRLKHSLTVIANGPRRPMNCAAVVLVIMHVGDGRGVWVLATSPASEVSLQLSERGGSYGGHPACIESGVRGGVHRRWFGAATVRPPSRSRARELSLPAVLQAYRFYTGSFRLQQRAATSHAIIGLPRRSTSKAGGLAMPWEVSGTTKVSSRQLATRGTRSELCCEA